VGTWQRIRSLLRREARDARELVDDTTARGNRALDRRERELNATPAEKLQIEQEKIAANDAEFDEIRRQLGG
jgi:histidinol dehydrogenase